MIPRKSCGLSDNIGESGVPAFSASVHLVFGQEGLSLPQPFHVGHAPQQRVPVYNQEAVLAQEAPVQRMPLRATTCTLRGDGRDACCVDLGECDACSR